MRIKFVVDWLGFTSPLTLMPIPELFVVTGGKGFTEVQPHNGYKTAYRNPLGALVQWNTERPEMRVLSQYSGTTLGRYIDAGIRPDQIMQIHANREDSRITRIDLAFDLLDTGFNIQQRYNELKSGNVKCSTSRANLVVGLDGGQTLYVGSRQSDKFLRIYDKAAEMSIPGDWVRVELEVKGDTARALGTQLVNASELTMARVAKQMLWSMVQWDDPIWQHLCSDTLAIDFSISHKKGDNIKSWLADQVAPAIGNYLIKGGDRDILDTLQVLVNSYIDRKSRL